MQFLPKARSENILVQEIGGEVMIYDTKSDKALCLNETCAVVFNHCDGKTTFEDLKRQFRYTDDTIHFALGELSRANLVTEVESGYFGNLTRREIIRRVGLSAAVAIPLITSLAAPRATQAASGLTPNGNSCTSNSECQSNQCGGDGSGPACCSADDFETCSSFLDCCTGLNCTNGVCCQAIGSVCSTQINVCCVGTICVPDDGVSGRGRCRA